MDLDSICSKASINLLVVVPLYIMYMSNGGFIVGLLSALAYYALTLYLLAPSEFVEIILVPLPNFYLISIFFQILFLILVSIYDNKMKLLKNPILTMSFYYIVNLLLGFLGEFVLLLGMVVTKFNIMWIYLLSVIIFIFIITYFK